MYQKNKKLIGEILKDFKADKVSEASAIQAIQNIISEEIERQDKNSDLYAVEEKEETPKTEGQKSIFEEIKETEEGHD